MTESSPSPQPPDEDARLTAIHARIALVLFAIYFLAYAGFMGLSALAPRAMALAVLGGANLAIIYGLALILGAVILALIYMFLCNRATARFHAGERSR